MFKKLHFLTFSLAIIIIALSLWDFFTLRLIGTIPNKECTQHLIPGITGAVLLIISPLYKETLPKWLPYLIILFLSLTALLWVSFILMKAYAHPFYIARHIVGIITILILLRANMGLLKN